MKNIPLPDLYYLENPDLKQLFRIMRISIFLLFFCLFSLIWPKIVTHRMRG